MKEEAKGRFERWHARQHELGACRCDGLPAKPPKGFEVTPPDPVAVAEYYENLEANGDYAPALPIDAMKRRAMGGGGYSREGIPSEVAANLDRAHQEMLHARYEADFEKGEAIAAKRMANSARTAYEAARARLEKEFGVEQVGKSIAALGRILVLQEDFEQLERDVDVLDMEASSLRCNAQDLAESAETVKCSLAKLREKLHE